MLSQLSSRLPLLHLLQKRRALPRFIAIQAAHECAGQMLNVAIGWYVYSLTHSPMSLAYVGLAQFLPGLGIALIAGQAADRFNKRKIIAISSVTQALCLMAFAFSVWTNAKPYPAASIYLLLFALSAARAFASPALSAMLPRLVNEEEFPRAVAVTSSAFQICTIAGPALGGLLYAIIGPATFTLISLFYFGAAMQTRYLEPHSAHTQSGLPDQSLLAGVRYIRANRLLLALISLDLFAVLLGGVTALLPIYARDILNVGPLGLGCLRCAPGLGAAIVGLVLAHRTIERDSGQRMLACVAGFGFATVVFAISTNFWLSLVALIAAGGFDMVSMVIRQTLLQLSTPDAMRGRVSAVNGVFIGASSELGEFESGATAAWFGVVPAALLGGLGTLVVVALWTRFFPELRGANKLAPAGTNHAVAA